MLVAFTVSFGCRKVASPAPVVAENAVWRAPNGYVIPYSEKDNWKEYTASELSSEKAEAKRWKSEGCDPGGTSTCGLRCVETRDRDADCTKESACAPCMNCGCTPTTPK